MQLAGARNGSGTEPTGVVSEVDIVPILTTPGRLQPCDT